jgi:hypothetical protein
MLLHEFADIAVSGVKNIRVGAQNLLRVIKKHLLQFSLENNARPGYRNPWRQ